ncbi:glycoside hydrolase family 16 protein [candidate division KSB1 bacterium]|nr:glycoside hydrolase family 16 protein [candidate division KSB1 bacterium]
MKKYAVLFILLIGIQSLSSCDKDEKNPVKSDENKIPTPDGYEAVWNDEFDGDQLDLTKWEYEVNADGGGNNELQYYTDRSQNSWVKDGVLVIQALKENYTGTGGQRDYTSARIRTRNKGDWNYGRFEIRAKLPYGKGLWPAIWMLPTDWIYGGWAASGEIDIMELIGHQPNKVYGTLHYGGTSPNNVHTGDSYTLTSGNFASEFHVFRLDWEPDQFRWYVDDVLYETQTEWYCDKSAFPAPFNQRFHMLLNVAVGGNWPGSPDTSTLFPQKMQIDYVRVYRKVKE